MNKSLLIATIATAVLLAGAGLAAWRWWAPLLEFRVNRIDVQSKDVIRGYFAGRQEFEATAKELARLYRSKAELQERLPMDVPSGSG
ncbi:MAG TPA: hypothetical protein VFU41_12995, partial [Gemmatimonadales bacterium]|nr:hypothetical protein [Gemmatimonadales bacterium]